MKTKPHTAHIARVKRPGQYAVYRLIRITGSFLPYRVFARFDDKALVRKNGPMATKVRVTRARRDQLAVQLEAARRDMKASVAAVRKCPACAKKRLHTPDEKQRHHPLAGHGFRRNEQAWTHPALAAEAMVVDNAKQPLPTPTN